MGQTSEKDQLNDYKNSEEGKSIIDIGKTTLEQNLYVCGNYNIEFFQNYIIEPISYPLKSTIKDYNQMARHKEIKEWHFFFAPKNNSVRKCITFFKRT